MLDCSHSAAREEFLHKANDTGDRGGNTRR